MLSKNFSAYPSLKTFITLFFVFSLAACSGSQPQELFTGNILSSSSVIDGDGAGDFITEDSLTAGDNTVTGSTNSSTTSTSSSSRAPKKAFKVAWNAPLQREDGSSLALSEIAEYRVYYGTKKGNYNHVIVVDGNSTLEAKDSSVPAGKYYVAVTTVDSDGRESSYSKEIIVSI